MRRTSVPAALAGLATVLASLVALPAPAQADHRTAPPATVTLVGSLQDELGCAQDWAPGCAA